MQGIKYGLLVNTIKKFPKSPIYGQPEVFSTVLTFGKHQISSAGCWLFEWT